MKVTYTVTIISIRGGHKKLATLGKKILSSLCGFNDVKMEIEKE